MHPWRVQQLGQLEIIVIAVLEINKKKKNLTFILATLALQELP